eukprot:CAMPEP_0116890404 /NCGR_PEP_ID=MMETSP0467-20121206/938_1 /TAXON_ID=283647 /ORGANISM="Mesodinium pulex, Strain SPMC105" /LENGTH=37 /DNA_ID= /DNA_START= /DNA_END= /DNA_ORIENTATION=
MCQRFPAETTDAPLPDFDWEAGGRRNGGTDEGRVPGR